MTLSEVIVQFWQELIARPTGPLGFRFVLQPVIAAGLAIRDGMRDAKLGRAPYLWTILRNPDERMNRVREGWHATARVLLIAALMDVAYQLVELGALRPLETVCVAFTLGYLPYLLVRGPAARIASKFRRSRLVG